MLAENSLLVFMLFYSYLPLPEKIEEIRTLLPIIDSKSFVFNTLLSIVHLMAYKWLNREYIIHENNITNVISNYCCLLRLQINTVIFLWVILQQQIQLYIVH